jgi:phosphate transport system substrate-binding protein
MKKLDLKKFIGFMLAFIMVFSLAACSSKDKSNDNSNETTAAGGTADLSGTITITGSTSVEKILLDIADEFMAYNPDVTINYTGTGSSAGIGDAIAGTNDIGVSSRNLKDEEVAKGLKTTVFAYDGIALVVHPSNPVKNLTKDQLFKIYSGEITNWSEVGGNNANIIVVSREGASGTRGAFEELIGLGDIGLTENATVVEGNGNVQNTVAGNENALGYVSFSFINESVKALSLDGVEPTAENAKAGNYLLSRPFLFTYKPEKLTDVSKAFLEFAISADAQDFVENHGGIRIE